MLSIFSSSYICEHTSLLMKNKSEIRVRMTDEHLSTVIRIAPSTFTPNIEKLASSVLVCYNCVLLKTCLSKFFELTSFRPGKHL